MTAAKVAGRQSGVILRGDSAGVAIKCSSLRVSEKTFQRQVEDVLRLFGYSLVYHTWTSIRSAAGFPDVVAVRIIGTPRTVYLELKGSTGQPTQDQQEWIEGLTASGEDARCYWPDQWDDLVEWLR